MLRPRMPNLPQRISLVSQTALFLKREIAAGTWSGWLPGERVLCETLQVSRNTLRAALRTLQAEGLVAPEHGTGSRILARPPVPLGARPGAVVGLLVPEPIERLRPSVTLWIDELRGLLAEEGARLHVHHGAHLVRSASAAALRKLVDQHNHAAWLLVLSSEPVQRWFERERVPCLVSGSCFPGVDLPSVDLDYRALCRHAAGVLLGLGHRRIALVVPEQNRAGDVDSESGFREGMRQSPHEDAVPVVVRAKESVEGGLGALRRLLLPRQRPTAVVVANPYLYLTFASRLAQLGHAVPRDLSLISRDDDPFLDYLVPDPARYTVRPHVRARRLLGPLLELMSQGSIPLRADRIMPEFHRGETLGPPPG
jgi:DNA-binding LacI/PurR family transcriptional regulator